MFGENDKSEFVDYKLEAGEYTDAVDNVKDYNNMFSYQSYVPNAEDSPVIPRIIQSHAQLQFGMFSTTWNERLDKSHWICDYSDDIFQTLKECELRRRPIWFRSPQVKYRPMLLKLLKDAAEKYKFARTTLHMGVYLLDYFMDNYTIRTDKINLIAITCLILAAKIEEADTEMPKFSDFNKLLDNAYTLKDFKNVECKLLVTFSFDLVRPTAATFAEHFANSTITLQDFHIFVNPWNNEFPLDQYHHYKKQRGEPKGHNNNGPDYSCPQTSHNVIIGLSSCPYNSYEDMLAVLNRTLFVLIDLSLNSLKFTNARPSIIASSCIAAARQIHGVFPIWTPYLIKLTGCTADMISPFVEAILAIYTLYYNNEIHIFQTPNSPVVNGPFDNTSILCASPDSGIVSGNDTKSMKSYTDDEVDDSENVPDDTDEEEDEPYRCLEYPLAKRRRLF